MIFTRHSDNVELAPWTRPRPVGVIDIGSNSVRLVVYEGPFRAPTPIFNEKELCGLGRNLASTGVLGPEATTCALGALKRFRAIADVLNVSTLKVIATAAARDARDGSAFIKKAEQILNVRVHVLTGQEEATVAAQGVMMGVTNPDGIAADLGGGSIELVDIKDGRIRNAVTLPLGGLRLIENTGSNVEDAAAIIDEALSRLDWLKDGRNRTFYAIGGTWRAFAKMHMAESDYPLNVMHEYDLDTDEAIKFADKIRKSKRLTDFTGASLVSKQRREVVPYGAILMQRLLTRMKPKVVQFSVFGVREGIVYSLLSDEERAKDPLLSYCDRLANLYARSAAHAHELCKWTDMLFDHPDLAETPHQRRLRHAACLISDIGWRAHPDYRGEQSLDAIAHSALSGIDHPGRIFLALSIYFRHVGRGDAKGDNLSTRLRKASGKQHLNRALIVGTAVRAAHMLSIGMPDIILNTTLSYEDGTLVWSIPKAHANLNGARLGRRFCSLAKTVDCDAEVRIVG
ncbi:MAG: Ppx/GppA family phosphatase [Alphaproteobacteria bacterium]|nr:Ppx/GppA family phosphatase [Alphaproteobacteria bacterium]